MQHSIFPQNHITKIAIIGDSYVGKTSLIERYINSNFTVNYSMTLGFNVISKNITNDNNNNPELLIFIDVSGEPRFSEVRKPCYSGVEIVLGVCDLTSKESLVNLERIWLPEIYSYLPLKSKSKPKLQIIANKCDLEDKIEITPDDLEDTFQRISLNFPELNILKPCLKTSAKLNLNIKESVSFR